MQQIFYIKKARKPVLWQYAAMFAAMMFPVELNASLFGARQPDNSFQQVVYTETPVSSYHSYPDDPNFVPESFFMMRTDSLNYDNNIEAARMAEANAHPGARISFADRPTIVCRDFGCTKMNDRITRTFLFNSLTNMFMMNAHSRMYICEADPFTRACIYAGISFPARAGIANAMVKIPKITIDQVNLSTGLSKAMIGMSYELLINGVQVRCAPTVTDIVVPTNAQSTLISREFACGMTTDGYTNVSFMFNIDYIDLDYGLLGGYYSLGLQGPSMGGGTGYALFKTEYSNAGLRANNAGITGSQLPVGTQTAIRPGEYAVEPLEK
ncbi:MAG: hypothetical protein FWG80_01165 [Alphaproteobacteria bacterium]|nr:hypothetical protein [Alphaproteobacteria bacterium]